MMQELLGGERKICMSNEGFVETTRPPSAPDQTQNLRCPRCDSTNTKFCYYNNYNLTQPRHFCKTCRRYWTKGGALRNVPIGGGCRKNKPSTTTISPSASSRLKSSFSISEIGKQIFLGTGFDHDLPPSTSSLLWSPPQNSHILGLLSMPLSTPINGAQVVLSDNNRSLLNQTPTIWRSNQQPNGEPQNSGIQELLQKLKTTTGGYYGNPQGTNAISSTNPSGIILESAPVSGPDFSYFTPPFSWSDVATPTPLRQ